MENITLPVIPTPRLRNYGIRQSRHTIQAHAPTLNKRNVGQMSLKRMGLKELIGNKMKMQ
jgi:hypothetical protein